MTRAQCCCCSLQNLSHDRKAEPVLIRAAQLKPRRTRHVPRSRWRYRRDSASRNPPSRAYGKTMRVERASICAARIKTGFGCDHGRFLKEQQQHARVSLLAAFLVFSDLGECVYAVIFRLYTDVTSLAGKRSFQPSHHVPDWHRPAVIVIVPSKLPRSRHSSHSHLLSCIAGLDRPQNDPECNSLLCTNMDTESNLSPSRAQSSARKTDVNAPGFCHRRLLALLGIALIL